MYLKSIEIHGFKSFANKINFQFHNGITAIVGPNGSGKSNVADAVRWVLGEQRIRQLRGSSMQDVIFAGTESRKPMGFAYVAITLDNSDHKLDTPYEEVTVARRLYRSGESEYLINGTTCRLKDVSELFYDTGIGKEGYSIIGQGQIDKILSDKPEDRRELFDEAAGIVKFKRRKETTEKKLASEQDNLVRVNDILSELEKQVGPLEKQSEKAQIYLKTHESLRKLDVNVFLLEGEDLQKRLNEAIRQLEIAASDLSAAREESEKNRSDYEAVQKELEELDRTIDETRDRITKASVVRKELEGQVNVYREQINAAQQNAEHFASRRDALRAEVERASGERDHAAAQHSAQQAKAEEAEATLRDLRAALASIQQTTAEIQDKIEKAKSGILSELDERANIKSRLASITTKEEQISIRRAELTSRLVSVESAESVQDKAIGEAEQKFTEISRQVSLLQKKKEELESEIAGIRPALQKEDELLSGANVRYHQEEGRLSTLRAMTERYEGFGGSVRRVMEQKSREKGLLGVVADLLKTDARYETAIEVALGGNIQNIVTEDTETAHRCIEMLKRDRAGRATFLPLTSVTNPQNFAYPDALRERGVIGLASSLVRCEPRFENVAKSLIGRTVVTDSFETARGLQQKYHHKLRVVTLDGELFTPGGAISGGAFRDSTNLLGRRREIAELESSAAKYKQQQEESSQRIEALKTRRNALRAENDTAGMEIQRLLIAQNTARIQLTREKEKAAEAAGSYEQLKEEDRAIQKQTEELTGEKQEMGERLNASRQTEQALTEEVNSLQKELEAHRTEEEQATAAVSRMEVEAGKIRQRADFEQQNLDRTNEEVQRYTDSLNEILKGIEEGKDEIGEKQQNIAEIEKTILASEETGTELSALLSKSAARKEELTEKQKQFFDQRDALNQKVSGLDKETYRLGAQRDKLQETIDARINYLWDEYQITPSDAASMRDESMTDLAGMKREASGLKGKIRELGPVNVNAIEEYRTLMERYTFLKTQHDDLEKAAEDLRKIIGDLDENMRRQFREQFARINAEFDKVFREMFGGGHGTLELMEGEDILEAGVRVIAQPPGKKLVNMMQMSGGEKALTAISLLFAIQNLKPSPFCLLDEIEAALDESNVGRFADYLHKLTKHTQFIVITHRRGTMERADRLYGITMQEKGVSALVSVSLIDKDLSN